MSLGHKPAHHIGVQLEELSGEEESAFDVVLPERGDDPVRPVGLVSRREHKVNVPDRRVGPYYSAIPVDVSVGEDGGAGHLILKFPSFTLIVGERECQRGGAVHRRLVGGVVVRAVVVDQVARLELLVVDTAVGVDSKQASEYGRVDRAVNQATGRVAHLVLDDERMRLGRECSAFRQLHDHADTPRVAAQKPVTQRAFHLLIGRVAGQLTVKDALGKHRRGQVVGTPYSRNAEHERMILPALIDALDARTHVPDEFRRHLAAEMDSLPVTRK